MERVASGSMLCRSATRRASVSSVCLRVATSRMERIWPGRSPIRHGADREEDIGHLAVLVEELGAPLRGRLGRAAVGERGDDLLQRQLGQFLLRVPQAVPQGRVRVDRALLHHQQDALGGALHQQPVLFFRVAQRRFRAPPLALEVQPLLGDVGQQPGDDDGDADRHLQDAADDRVDLRPHVFHVDAGPHDPAPGREAFDVGQLGHHARLVVLPLPEILDVAVAALPDGLGEFDEQLLARRVGIVRETPDRPNPGGRGASPCGAEVRDPEVVLAVVPVAQMSDARRSPPAGRPPG